MIHHDLIRYRRASYLWWSLILIVASSVLYGTQRSSEPPNGGTWQGYTLGTVSALLIIWLAFLGIRKRRYRSSIGTVQGWTSAHVYLGTAVLIIATLHTAGQFGWNVHTLAYVVMCFVIFSGFYGVYAYLRHPRLSSANRSGHSRDTLFTDLYETNETSRALSRYCDPESQMVVHSSIERTSLGGGVLAQLLATDRSKFVRQIAGSGGGSTSAPIANQDQQQVIDFVADRIPRAEKRSEAKNLQSLLSVLCTRQAILRRIRRDIQLQAWLQVWLFIHIPFTFALLAALVVHITTTFLYW